MLDRSKPAYCRQSQESPSVKHNSVGAPYSVKLVYPGFYNEIDIDSKGFVVGFPKSKRRLAKQIETGHLFFMYVTSPEKWIIGLGRVLTPAREIGAGEGKRPFEVPLEWVIGPKSVGVRFVDVDLVVRPRIGDSLYALDVKDGLRIIARLRELPDVTRGDLDRRIALYKKLG